MHPFFEGGKDRPLWAESPANASRVCHGAVCLAPNRNQFYGGAVRMRVKIVLACTECKQRNYLTKKNKKNDPDRLEMNKYCRFCRKHTLHRETK